MDEIIGILIAALVAAIVVSQLKGLQRIISAALVGLAAVVLIGIVTASGQSTPTWLSNLFSGGDGNGAPNDTEVVEPVDSNQTSATDAQGTTDNTTGTSPTDSTNSTTPTSPPPPETDPTVPVSPGDSSNRRPVSGMW
ncbi:MAG: hypothetical protein ACFB8W_13255 [Elainellaceae cyanobacterium]